MSAVDELAEAAARFTGHLAMLEAWDALGEFTEPLTDETVVTGYMAAGASDYLRISDFRALDAALSAWVREVKAEAASPTTAALTPSATDTSPRP